MLLPYIHPNVASFSDCCRFCPHLVLALPLSCFTSRYLAGYTIACMVSFLAETKRSIFHSWLLFCVALAVASPTDCKPASQGEKNALSRKNGKLAAIYG